MKGIIVKEVGGNYELTSELSKPSPGPHQILVRCLVTGINMVETYMQSTGLLIISFPIVLGCDASGEVVSLGEGVTKFKIGDKVFGCTRLGMPSYGTFQEFHLMDENLTFKNGGKLTTEQAATVGVGVLTAALGLISGLKVPLSLSPSTPSSEWIIILGDSGGVGSYAVQLAKLAGFKVLGSCSASGVQALKELGADETLDHRTSVEEQIKRIGEVTEGKFRRVFDASAVGTETGMGALERFGEEEERWFSTVNDWQPITPLPKIQIFKTELGIIGRTEGNPRTSKVNGDISSFIPKLEKLIEQGKIKPMDYEKIGGTGVEEILKGMDVFTKQGAKGKKLVVRVSED